MNELYFFYEYIDEKLAIKEFNSFKSDLLNLLYELDQYQLPSRNPIYCCDHSAYSIEELEFGPPISFQSGWIKKFHSYRNCIQDKYNLWVKKSIPLSTDNSEEVTINLNRYFNGLNELPEPLQLLFGELIKDFTLKLIDVNSDQFTHNSFHYLEKPNISPMLPEEASKTLSNIYDFSYKGTTLTQSVSKKEWIEFFVLGKIPSTDIKLNFNTKASADILEYLSNTFNLNKRQFYKGIEKSGVIITKSGSILTYRNISKSNSDFTPNALKFRDTLKKYLL